MIEISEEINCEKVERRNVKLKVKEKDESE